MFPLDDQAQAGICRRPGFPRGADLMLFDAVAQIDAATVWWRTRNGFSDNHLPSIAQ